MRQTFKTTFKYTLRAEAKLDKKTNRNGEKQYMNSKRLYSLIPVIWYCLLVLLLLA
jgi:hypothetical protein